MLLLRIHNKKELENKKFILDELGYMLGVYWQLDDLSKPVKLTPKFKQDKVMLPLAVAIATSGMNPKAFSKTIDELKKKAYANNNNMNTGTDNANALSREDFVSMFNKGVKMGKRGKKK